MTRRSALKAMIGAALAAVALPVLATEKKPLLVGYRPLPDSGWDPLPEVSALQRRLTNVTLRKSAHGSTLVEICHRQTGSPSREMMDSLGQPFAWKREFIL